MIELIFGLVIIVCLYLIVYGFPVMVAMWRRRRERFLIVDMFDALMAVETAHYAVQAEKGHVQFVEARRLYDKQRESRHFAMRFIHDELGALQRRINVRLRELRDEEFKDIAQQHYDQMVEGGKTTEQLSTLAVSLNGWMEVGQFKLTDFGHPHDRVDKFLIECGAKTASVSEPIIGRDCDPLEHLEN